MGRLLSIRFALSSTFLLTPCNVVKCHGKISMRFRGMAVIVCIICIRCTRAKWKIDACVVKAYMLVRIAFDI